MQVLGLVIHLRRATNRAQLASALCAQSLVPCSIEDAVDGSTLSVAELERVYQPNSLAPAYPFDLGSAEIGCFLSHRQAWAKLIESDADAALVLEDDMSIGAPFSDALRLACRNVERFGYVQFQTRPQSGDVVGTEGSASLFQPSVTPLGACGQLVSRDCAARLLELTEIFDRPVDTFLQMHWHTGTRVTAIWPSGLEDMSGASGGSTIKKKRPIAEKLLREFQRARYRQLVAKQSKRSVST